MLSSSAVSIRHDDGPEPHALADSFEWDVDCDLGDNSRPAFVTRVREGIDYLTREKGDKQCGAPTRTCERVSCADYAGIYYCNDSVSSPCALFP